MVIFIERIKYRGDVVLFTDSMGDDVYGLSLLHDFKKTRNKKLTVVGLSSRQRLFEFYQDTIDDIHLVDKDSIRWNLVRRVRFSRLAMKLGQTVNVYSICPFFWIPMWSNRGRTAISIIRNEMLNIPSSTNIVTPDFSSEPITSICDFDAICSKVVILNPYSTSMNVTQWSMFEEIAAFLQSKGYIVYTNAPYNKKIIEGTLPLDCSIYEFFSICDKIPLVVSVRTGLMDFCVACKAQFIVFYFPINDKYFEPLEEFYNRHTLSAWGKENVVELLYKDNATSLKAVSNIILQYN